MERLQKVIAASGYCSRRKAEELIVAGRVRVNGKIVSDLGSKVSKSDKIWVDGQLLEKEELVYYLLNKPRKTICSAADQFSRTTVVDLVAVKQRIVPVGRLDYDTSGALLLCNDGKLIQELTHPSYQIAKVYEVDIEGICSKQQIESLERGLLLADGKKSYPASVRVLAKDINKNSSKIEITVFEGRNHLIKMMVEALGFKLKKLHRSSFANLNCDKLPLGSYRPLKPYELKQLKAFGQAKGS